jgi:nicotinate-nucleotide adenylyltransferase
VGGVIIFGGSFDPIHQAHLMLAEGAADELGARKVLFVPAARPPHKDAAVLSAAVHRAEMVRLAIEGNERFAVSLVELDRGGRSYTIDTIRTVTEEEGGERPFLLIGGDTLLELASWRSPESIAEEAELVVAPRPGFDPQRAPALLAGRFRLLKTPVVDLSASRIRRWVAEGRSVRYLLPEAVRLYVEAHRLYRDEGER